MRRKLYIDKGQIYLRKYSNIPALSELVNCIVSIALKFISCDILHNS